MNEMEASSSFKFMVGSACSYNRQDGSKLFEVVPLVSCAIRMYRVIKVLGDIKVLGGVLPELRTRVNLTLPEQVFFT